MRLTCSGCGQTVLLAANSRVLTPEPTLLGIYDPTDGEHLTARDIRNLVAMTGRAGHGNHTCPPPEQISLFDHQEAT